MMFHMKHLIKGQRNRKQVKFMKVIINTCFGGFSFSKKAKRMICNLKGLDYKEVEKNVHNYMFSVDRHPNLRTDKDVIYTVEHLGDEANTKYSKLVIMNIPNGSHFAVSDYDGYEKLFFSEEKIYCLQNKNNVSYETFKR